MTFAWPPGFPRIPDEEWTRQPIEDLAVGYDTVERHGWYANLDPTVDEVTAYARDGHVLIDYSGGTGILIQRILAASRDRAYGLVNVDSSPKFLRLSLEKFRDEDRVAFRHIRFLKDQKRLAFVDEALGSALTKRGVDGFFSTNAVHLYYDLVPTFASWARVMRPGARAFVQSGNIGDPAPHGGRWIIDKTVDAIGDAAREIVHEDERYRAHRAVAADEARMAQYEALTRKYFLPVRPLRYYTDALEQAGLEVVRVVHRPIEANVLEWFEFLSVYHEGVLPWVGGSEKIDGRPASDEHVTHRHELMRRALQRVFEGRETFEAEWTYITAGKPG